MQRTYRAEIAKLASLETFRSDAFAADEKSIQDSCDFVLALAVAFNDLKNILMGEYLLLGQAPSSESAPSREVGSFVGLHLYTFRLLLATLREILVLIKNESSARQHPLILKVTRNLPRASRAAWDKLLQAADTSASNDPDIRFLVIARNSVVFHYSGSAIGKGFRRAFHATSQETPFISRGDSLSSTRFYFADRAVQSYLEEIFADGEIEKYFLNKSKFLSDLALAIHAIITGFITARGVGWRSHSAEP